MVDKLQGDLSKLKAENTKLNELLMGMADKYERDMKAADRRVKALSVQRLLICGIAVISSAGLAWFLVGSGC